MKYCEDCKYFQVKWIDKFIMGSQYAISTGKCINPQVSTEKDSALEFVMRDRPPSTCFASTERDPRFDSINKCGSEGKLWEPKKEGERAV